jgi:hypothetical protein
MTRDAESNVESTESAESTSARLDDRDIDRVYNVLMAHFVCLSFVLMVVIATAAGLKIVDNAPHKHEAMWRKLVSNDWIYLDAGIRILALGTSYVASAALVLGFSRGKIGYRFAEFLASNASFTIVPFYAVGVFLLFFQMHHYNASGLVEICASLCSDL